jgi:hypothetical protein
MSRSRKKTPVSGNTTARSEAFDKQQWHSRMRSLSRKAVQEALDVDPGAVVYPVDDDAKDPWSMVKDGKHRFDPKKWPKEMRK